MEKATASRSRMCLLITCGLPGAGKTTLCNQFASTSPPHGFLKKLASSAVTSLVVHFDDLIPDELPLEVNNKKSCTAWKRYREEIKRNIEQFMRKLVTNEDDTQINPEENAKETSSEPETPVTNPGSESIVTNSQQSAVTNSKSESAVTNSGSTVTNSGSESAVTNSRSESAVTNSGSTVTNSGSESTMTDSGSDSAVDQNIRSDVRQKFQDLLAKQTFRTEHLEDSDSFILIVDDNMFYRSMRYEYYQLARKYGTGFAQVFIECPADVALSRNKSRQHPVSMETINNMAAHLERPDSSKASWEQFTAVLDAKKDWDEDDMQLIWSALEEAFANPVGPLKETDLAEQEESRKASLASIIHQADVTLRKCVAETIKKFKAEKQPSKVELRELASKLNSIRTDILDKIKQGQLVLPSLLFADEDQEPSHNKEFHKTLQTIFRTRYST